MSSYEDAYKRLGFISDPFTYPHGEKAPDEFLEATWVDFPNSEKVLNLDQSSILLAPPGSGKTAWRRYLEKKIASEDQQFLSVVYNQFEIPKNRRIRLNDHKYPLLRQIARAVINYLENTWSLDNKNASSDSCFHNKLWWYAFLIHFLPQYYQPKLEQLFPDHSGVLPQWGNLTNLQEIILQELVPRLISIGLDRLYILVDDLDGILETQNPDSLAALIDPLINNTHLLSDSKLVWKLFGPKQLQADVQKSHSY
ncbi:MAG: hypothetical protein IPM39_04430, partial [Chloroflexi bacterium]|nr:hypothetical protein [Chloroflexota bacterium]